ncbi:Hint domain-containing protein [Rhodobacteraceae bacterium LMO-12]|nr:Hint domain-containing protein [Rhodobacteraceae bacterium LMO-JJ12]
MTQSNTRPAHALPVYTSAMLSVVNGANLGDPLSHADDLQLEDSYALRHAAEPVRLAVMAGENGHFVIAQGTATGTPGATVVLDSCLTLMTRASEVVELLVLVEIDETGHARAIYGLPLAPLEAKAEYLLVGIDREAAKTRMAQMACVSFTRGTQITMATGQQRPIESLQIGDRVLTRDDGAQEIRWIGNSTMRASGEFAPIRIAAGALHNAGDLLVSPDHRLFIYQRSDAFGAGRSELLIKARHLVNGDTIHAQPGGFVDYFQLLFDRHQIIFAEGIAAETLLADQRTHAALPRALADKLLSSGRNHGDAAHLEFEVSAKLLDRPDAAALLRRASTR